jgi:hypothetical protein
VGNAYKTTHLREANPMCYTFRLTLLALTLAVSLCRIASGAETATASRMPAAGASLAVVSGDAVATNVLRIGLNMNQQSQYDDRAYLQNYLDNPGFEQAMQGHVILVGANPTSGSFTDTNDVYGPEPNGFWNGVTASVRTGISAGRTFEISRYMAGGKYTCSEDCPTLAQGDIIGETISNASLGYVAGSTLPGNWLINNSDSGITLTTAQKYEGASSLSFDVHDGDPHSVWFGLDTSSGSVGVCSNNRVTLCQTSTDCGGNICRMAPYYPWHPIKGSLRMSIYARAVGTNGTPSVTLAIARQNSSWGSVSHTFHLTQDGAWHRYSYNFTGADQATDTKILSFTIRVQNGDAQSGAKIYVDNAFVGPRTGAAGGFRKEVLTTLQTLNPGILRYTVPQALAQTDAYFEGTDYQKGPSSDWSGSGNVFSWYFSPKDMYAVAGAIGAAPWLSIPDVWSDADLKAFAANLCTAFSAYNLTEAFVEQSNEDWVSSSYAAGGGDTIKYGAMASRNFGLIDAYMVSNCASYAGKVRFMVGGQEDNYGVVTAASSQLPRNNPQYGVAIADYIPDEDDQNTGQTMAEYAHLGFANSLNQFRPDGHNVFTNNVPGNLSQLCGGAAAGCQQFMAVYENGNGNQCGTANPIEAYGMSAGWIAAGFNAQNWILGFLAGSDGPNRGKLSPMVAQNLFDLAELEFPTPNRFCTSGHGTTSAIWGVVHDFDSDFGPSFPHIRPIGWALALANRAIAGDYHPMATEKFPGVYGAAFKSVAQWSALLSNANNAEVPIRIGFPDGFPPSIGETVAYTNSISDNNEDSNSVHIGSLRGGIAVSAHTIKLTLPPLSVVALEAEQRSVPGESW